MSDLSEFPITTRWPAQHPDRLQLYSTPTPNGVKVAIALEEIGLPCVLRPSFTIVSVGAPRRTVRLTLDLYRR